ncbi:unnamed protein product, partial [Prorocentrum cordatum]
MKADEYALCAQPQHYSRWAEYRGERTDSSLSKSMSSLLRYRRNAERHGLTIYGGGWAKLQDLARILGEEFGGSREEICERIRFAVSTSLSNERNAYRFESDNLPMLGEVVRATDKSEHRGGRPQRSLQHGDGVPRPAWREPAGKETRATVTLEGFPERADCAPRAHFKAAPNPAPDMPAAAKQPAPARSTERAPDPSTGPPPKRGGAAEAATAPASAALASLSAHSAGPPGSARPRLPSRTGGADWVHVPAEDWAYVPPKRSGTAAAATAAASAALASGCAPSGGAGARPAEEWVHVEPSKRCGGSAGASSREQIRAVGGRGGATAGTTELPLGRQLGSEDQRVGEGRAVASRRAAYEIGAGHEHLRDLHSLDRAEELDEVAKALPSHGLPAGCQIPEEVTHAQRRANARGSRQQGHASARGGRSQDPELLSRQLASLLRHKARSCGLVMTNAGFVEFAALMRELPRFTGQQVRREDVQRVVANSYHQNGEPRFEFGYSQNNVLQIRARRNHSIPGVEISAFHSDPHVQPSQHPLRSSLHTAALWPRTPLSRSDSAATAAATMEAPLPMQLPPQQSRLAYDSAQAAPARTPSSARAPCPLLGSVVEVQGLQTRAHLNGRRGRAVAWLPDAALVRVELDDGSRQDVRPANLAPAEPAARAR